MKLVRLARNVILARLAWRYIAKRRALARRQRRARRIVAPVLIAGSAGAVWAARRRIVAGARRALDGFAPQKVARQATTASEAAPEHKPDLSEPQKNRTPSPGDGKTGRHAAARRTAGHGEPVPSPKKRRRRARQQSAAEREKAERESAPPAKVKVEINETPELRAPIGDLKH
jgi:hypothetical protein